MDEGRLLRGHPQARHLRLGDIDLDPDGSLHGLIAVGNVDHGLGKGRVGQLLRGREGADLLGTGCRPTWGLMFQPLQLTRTT